MPAVFQTTAVGQCTLDDLCPIPNDKVASTVLLSTSTSKQIVICLGQGQELADHQTPSTATIHVLEGAAKVRIADAMIDETYNLESGGMVVIPPRITHSVMAVQATRMLLTLVQDAEQ